MAEDLEDPHGETSNPCGSQDFLNHQLAVYKHRFRIGAIDGEDNAIQSGFEQGFADAAKISRRLGRLKGSLVALISLSEADSNRISELKDFLHQTEALLKRLSLADFKFTQEIQEEISAENAPKFLPIFDPSDMELFLGNYDPSLTGTAEPTGVPLNQCTDENVTAMRAELNQISSETCDLLNKVTPHLQEMGLPKQFIVEDLGLHSS